MCARARTREYREPEKTEQARGSENVCANPVFLLAMQGGLAERGLHHEKRQRRREGGGEEEERQSEEEKRWGQNDKKREKERSMLRETEGRESERRIEECT